MTDSLYTPFLSSYWLRPLVLGLERRRWGSRFVLSGLHASLCGPGLFYPPHSFLGLLGQLRPKKSSFVFSFL